MKQHGKYAGIKRQIQTETYKYQDAQNKRHAAVEIHGVIYPVNCPGKICETGQKSEIKSGPGISSVNGDQERDEGYPRKGINVKARECKDKEAAGGEC